MPRRAQKRKAPMRGLVAFAVVVRPWRGREADGPKTGVSQSTWLSSTKALFMHCANARAPDE
jgi:hypothetical protein